MGCGVGAGNRRDDGGGGWGLAWLGCIIAAPCAA
jgi:hypothetical protein